MLAFVELWPCQPRINKTYITHTHTHLTKSMSPSTHICERNSTIVVISSNLKVAMLPLIARKALRLDVISFLLLLKAISTVLCVYVCVCCV